MEAGRLPLGAAARGELASDDDASHAGESLGDSNAFMSIANLKRPPMAHPLVIYVAHNMLSGLQTQIWTPSSKGTCVHPA